jgi:hypothetical protein
MEKTDPYGNPATKSFRKQHVRLVTAAGTSALVNVAILNIAARFLHAAAAAGATLPERLEGWTPLPDGAEPQPQHYGLTLPASVADPDLAAQYGFTLVSAGLYAFTGDLDTEHAAAIDAETQQVLALVNPPGQPEPPERLWSNDLPGAREPGPDARGDDVQYFQLLYACPDQDGVMNAWDTQLIKELQRRWGLEQTGIITVDTWRMLLPNPRNYDVEFGDVGPTVRMLQALLTAYDWTDGTLPITGRFDQATGRALASVQETYGLRNRPAAGAPEWAALIGRWPI